MSDYNSHIQQAKKNLRVLSDISQTVNDSWDWQVTCSYYVAVHLFNGHIAKIANLHYKTHEKVKVALFDELSPCKIPDEIYLSYVKLENLSRRARYLCHENPNNNSTDGHAFLTFDRHLKKAVIKLEDLLNYFSSIHGESFEPCQINCIELKDAKIPAFPYRQAV